MLWCLSEEERKCKGLVNMVSVAPTYVCIHRHTPTHTHALSLSLTPSFTHTLIHSSSPYPHQLLKKGQIEGHYTSSPLPLHSPTLYIYLYIKYI